MKIDQNILNIIANSRVEGNLLYLPDEQLDRKTYEAVNKCLINLGGKWVRGKKAHVFDSDPTDGIENIILTGETTDWKKEFQFFPHP